MQLTMAAPKSCAISLARPASSGNRTWLKRAAIVGWLIYALGVVLFPFWDEAKERNRALDRNAASYQVCKQAASDRGIPDKQSECDSVYQARMERDDEAYQFGSEYRAMGWHLAWIVPVAMIAPPLILYVLVYGIIALCFRIAFCFGRAFQE